MVAIAGRRTTLRVITAIVLVTTSIPAAYILDSTPVPYRRPPNNLAVFAHLTAAHLNARNLDSYQVIRATVGQQQFWITAEADASERGMLNKHKNLVKLHRWKNTVVVFHNDAYGTIASDPDERAQGCVTTVGRFVIFGDPMVVEQIAAVWRVE